MQNKILIINSHPDDKSYNYALSERYVVGAKKSGAEVKIINLYKLDFKPFFRGLEHENTIEDNIKESQILLKWANHIVFFYPIWWATIPALLKSFLERVLVPGFSNENSKSDREFLQWHELLSGKTARLIVTMDSPPLFHIFKVKQPSYHTMKDILKFCGINSIKKTYFGSVKMSDEHQRKLWLDKVERLGKENK